MIIIDIEGGAITKILSKNNEDWYRFIQKSLKRKKPWLFLNNTIISTSKILRVYITEDRKND